MRIALVGCGFLGSLFAEEFAKRAFAFDEELEWTLIDFDQVEERNAANQNFDLLNAEESKVEAVEDRLMGYRNTVSAHAIRLDKTNINELLHDAGLVVSAVDNLPTRELLWYYAKETRKPLLHLGISQMGTGNVEWTVGRYDTWSMSPLATLGQTKKIMSAENIPQ